MKKILYVIIFIMCFTFKINDIYADELEKILEPYKKEAEKVTARYQLDENYTDENGNKKNGIFIIEISNLTEDLKVKIDDGDFIRYDKTDNGTLILNGIESGIKKIYIYSVKVPTYLRTITVNIPKYNYYSEREECNGISKEELDVCDKWYKYELNETTFLKKINEYKKAQEENKDNNNQSKIQIIFNNIVNFLKSYFIYIIIFIVIVCSITIYITIRKKKYSLE